MLQHAAIPHMGALDSITQLIEVLLDSENATLILHSVDLSKAFDRVKRDILFNKLHCLGITGPLWKAIVSLFQLNNPNRHRRKKIPHFLPPEWHQTRLRPIHPPLYNLHTRPPSRAPQLTKWHLLQQTKLPGDLFC